MAKGDVTIKVGLSDEIEETVRALPHQASAFDLVAAQAWAISPGMLETICSIARRENESPSAVEAKLGRPLQNTRQVSMRGSVAIVPITGPVFRYANLFTDISGATSLEVLARDFSAALDNPAVASIVLNIDSPGGQAAGIAEMAQMIKASNKPVTAYVDGTAASAAYWLASAADKIVMSKTGEVGSIGAVFSVSNKSDANVIEIVSSQSPKKRTDINTEEGRSQIQARADKFAQIFIEDVAAYRGVSTDTVLADFGQGDMRMGAEAVALGMADSVSTLEEVIANLNKSTATKGAIMGQPGAQSGAELPTINLEYLAANHPDIVSAISVDAAKAERERIQSVRAQTIKGHEALIERLAFDGITTGPEAAIQVLAAENILREKAASTFIEAAPAAVEFAAAPEAEGNDAAASDDQETPVEDRAKAKWDADKGIRSEFAKFETYLAYFKASESGAVKILKTTKE